MGFCKTKSINENGNDRHYLKLYYFKNIYKIKIFTFCIRR